MILVCGTIMQALTGHLLAFADEVGLRRTEWMAGLDFLTRTGQKSDDLRLEMMLLSDLLGLSALIDIIEHAGGDDGTAATDPTLLGPFYHPDAPLGEYGDSTLEAEDPSERLRVHGIVTSADGSPLGGAQIEIWQNGHDGWYTIQDLERFPIGHLRGTYCTRADGSFLINCLRPVDYPVPMDGPPGEMLRATGREGMRAADLHFRRVRRRPPDARDRVVRFAEPQAEHRCGLRRAPVAHPHAQARQSTA